jgi:hypothetical protein
MGEGFKGAIEKYKVLESLSGLVPSVFAVINNYFYQFIEIHSTLRLRASVITFLGSCVMIGMTTSIIHDKKGSAELRPWLRKVLMWSTVAGFVCFGVYNLLLKFFEQHSYNGYVSTLFDWCQIGLFALPFVCWTTALVALVGLFYKQLPTG